MKTAEPERLTGQYLATQADDNSLKIWRTDDWQLERDITEPFEDAPKLGVTTNAPSGDQLRLGG
jgi:protein HIRA/HIR1